MSTPQHDLNTSTQFCHMQDSRKNYSRTQVSLVFESTVEQLRSLLTFEWDSQVYIFICFDVVWKDNFGVNIFAVKIILGDCDPI